MPGGLTPPRISHLLCLSLFFLNIVCFPSFSPPSPSLSPSPLICFHLLLLSISLSPSSFLSFSPLLARLASPPPQSDAAAAQGLIYRLRVGSTCQLRNVRIVYGNSVVLARRCVGFSWRRGFGFMSRRSCKVEGGSFSWCSLPRFVVVSKQGALSSLTMIISITLCYYTLYVISLWF